MNNPLLCALFLWSAQNQMPDRIGNVMFDEGEASSFRWRNRAKWRTLDVLFYADGTVQVFTEDNTVPKFQDITTEAELLKLLDWVAGK